MTQRLAPLFSLYEDDIDLEEDLASFVVGLAERVDCMQDAGSARDLGNLHKLSVELEHQAARFGYPPLVAAVEAVRCAGDLGSDDAIEDALMELTRVARRVRQGHRGSA
jgi:hypothetical protein